MIVVIIKQSRCKNEPLIISCRSQGSSSLTHGSGAVRLLGLRVRIQPGAWMSVSCVCCVFSGRCLCDGPITRPGEFYQAYFWLWSWRLHMMKSGPTGGCCAMGKMYYYLIIVTPDGSCFEVPKEYTGCNRRNGPDFGRVFLVLNYNEKPQNTYIQSWTVWEIMASEVWNFDSCYTLTDYQIRIEIGRNMWFL